MAQTSSSQLFTLRVWSELTEEGQIRWRGKLRHIPSDTVHYFRDWASLVPLLLSILRRYPPVDSQAITPPDS
jgi:hypothetical protein